MYHLLPLINGVVEELGILLGPMTKRLVSSTTNHEDNGTDDDKGKEEEEKEEKEEYYEDTEENTWSVSSVRSTREILGVIDAGK